MCYYECLGCHRGSILNWRGLSLVVDPQKLLNQTFMTNWLSCSQILPSQTDVCNYEFLTTGNINNTHTCSQEVLIQTFMLHAQEISCQLVKSPLTVYSFALYQVEVVDPGQNSGTKSSHQSLQISVVHVEKIFRHCWTWLAGCYLTARSASS